LEFAKQALVSEKLGQHEDVDFMAVSLSSTDYVGHQFGINSMEIEDTYYRLDIDLATFILFLDAHVGKGNYLLFLTADHGAAANPELNEDHGIPSGVFNETLQKDSLKKALYNRFGSDDLMLFSDAYGIFLNHRLIESKGISYNEVENFCLSFVLGFKGVRCALSASMLQGNDYREGISRLVQRGYNRQRSADICIQLEPGWIDWSLKTGTSHGSPYAYDTHVPLLFFGWGVKKGTAFQPTSVCDIAPTIASFLRIQEPSGTVGHTLLPFLSK